MAVVETEAKKPVVKKPAAKKAVSKKPAAPKKVAPAFDKTLIAEIKKTIKETKASTAKLEKYLAKVTKK